MEARNRVAAAMAAMGRLSDQHERTIQDTVALSGSSQEIVNLARSGEFADEIRIAPLDKDFATNLLKAQEDISRIIRLLTETTKTVFLEKQKEYL